MIKKFNDNTSYFKWYNKYSDQIKVQKIDVKEKIIVKYERKINSE